MNCAGDKHRVESLNITSTNIETHHVTDHNFRTHLTAGTVKVLKVFIWSLHVYFNKNKERTSKTTNCLIHQEADALPLVKLLAEIKFK